jgi:hypothetical protein
MIGVLQAALRTASLETRLPTLPANFASPGGLYTYHVSQYPEEPQPSGTFSYSRSDTVTLRLNLFEDALVEASAPPRGTAFPRRGSRASPASPRDHWVAATLEEVDGAAGTVAAVQPAEPHRVPAHDRNCPLCLEALSGPLLCLPCGHCLHWKCRQAVQHYATGKGQCPECRAQAPWPLPVLAEGCHRAVLAQVKPQPAAASFNLFREDPAPSPEAEAQ